MSKQRILVVDDDTAVVRLIRSYLEQAGYEVLTAYNGETALHTIRRDRPDLVLLDLMLPDKDGWDITRIVRSDPNLATLPILMLTARVTDTDKIVGLELGADDYITKPYNPREVVARVRARLRVQQGLQQAGAPNPRLRIGTLELDPNRMEVTLNGQVIELTMTEFSLLQVLMSQPGYVLTRSELIQQAMGHDFEGVERTLDSHIRNLRRKIGDDPKQPTFIKTIYGVGYRMDEE
jgi:two-component system, OmpR family, alkaline phosphatase synthesis response regulator PhoP